MTVCRIKNFLSIKSKSRVPNMYDFKIQNIVTVGPSNRARTGSEATQIGGSPFAATESPCNNDPVDKKNTKKEIRKKNLKKNSKKKMFKQIFKKFSMFKRGVILSIHVHFVPFC